MLAERAAVRDWRLGRNRGLFRPTLQFLYRRSPAIGYERPLRLIARRRLFSHPVAKRVDGGRSIHLLVRYRSIPLPAALAVDKVLLAQAKARQDRPVTVLILLTEVGQVPASLPDHHEQTPP